MNASVFYTQLTYCTLRSCNYHCVCRVFIYYYRCGTVGFGVLFLFSIWFQPLPVLYHNHSCSLHYLSITVVSVYPTSAKLSLHSLWAVIHWVADTLGSSTDHRREHLESNIPLGSKWQWQESAGLRSEPYTFWQFCHQLFHMDPCCVIEPW